MKLEKTNEQIELLQKAIEHLRDIELKEELIKWNKKAAENFRNTGLDQPALKCENLIKKAEKEQAKSAFAYKTIIEQLNSNI